MHNEHITNNTQQHVNQTRFINIEQTNKEHTHNKAKHHTRYTQTHMYSKQNKQNTPQNNGKTDNTINHKQTHTLQT